MIIWCKLCVKSFGCVLIKKMHCHLHLCWIHPLPPPNTFAATTIASWVHLNWAFNVVKCLLKVIHVHSLCCSLPFACCLSCLSQSLANCAVIISTCWNDSALVCLDYYWTCIQCNKLQNPFYVYGINVISAAPTIHAINITYLGIGVANLTLIYS